MKRTKNVYSGKVALVIAADKFSILAAAVMAHKEKIVDNHRFLNDIYIVKPHKTNDLDLSFYDHVYVIGLNPANMEKGEFQEFFFRHRKNLRFWYSRKKLDKVSADLLASESFPVFADANFLSFAKNGGIKFETINLLNSYLALEEAKKKSLRTKLSETFRKSLYVAKINARLDKKNDSTDCRLYAELFLLSLKESGVSTNNCIIKLSGSLNQIPDLLESYKQIKENQKKAKKEKATHPLLGSISIFKPENDLVDRKIFFRKLESYDAVAIAALDQDPKGRIYEVCLNNKKAKLMTDDDWKKIPFISRINGHRFFVGEKYLLHS